MVANFTFRALKSAKAPSYYLFFNIIIILNLQKKLHRKIRYKYYYKNIILQNNY